MDIPFIGSKKRPRYFKLHDEDNEYYMIGSEVGAYMNLFRGAIYKKYPSLWRRLATTEERNRIQKLHYSDVNNFATSITLVKAVDIKNIIEGLDEKYKLGLAQAAMESSNQKIAKLTARPTSQMNLAGFSAYNKNFRIFNKDRPSNCNFKLNDFDIFSEPISLLTPPVLYPLNSMLPLLVTAVSDPPNANPNKMINNADPKKSSNILTTKSKNWLPIRIYIEKDGMILNDILLWNINDDSISMQEFARVLCQDIGYPHHIFADLIIDEMKSQIKNHIDNIAKLKKLTSKVTLVIKVDILVRDVNYCDQFNWTIVPDDELGYRSEFDPVEFANILVQDLSLSREFIPPLVCAIYGQINYHMSHPNLFSYKHGGIDEEDASLYSYFHLQNEQDQWTPKVKVLPMQHIQTRHNHFAQHLKLIQQCISLKT